MDGNRRCDITKMKIGFFMSEKTFVISLGGSLIAPHDIDTEFLKEFKKIILAFTKRNRMILFCGGGYTARHYQSALKTLSPIISAKKIDWMGVEASFINAMLMRLVFDGHCDPEIITDPRKKHVFKKNILIGSGWKWRTGHSTDYTAVVAAHTYKVQTVLNLSNISYVYNKDPKKYANAKFYKKMSYKELIHIVGSIWIPGAHVPFDPKAALFAEKKKLKLVFLQGSNLKNFKNFLQDLPFQGTIVS